MTLQGLEASKGETQNLVVAPGIWPILKSALNHIKLWGRAPVSYPRHNSGKKMCQVIRQIFHNISCDKIICGEMTSFWELGFFYPSR